MTAIRAGQGDATAAEHARRLIDLSLAHLEAGRVRLVLVGGLPGTGKSTICAGIAEQFPTTVLRSDVIRKELVGLPANRAAPAAVGEGIYDEAMTTRTYETMLARTSIALAHGESVVLDASWTDPSWRAAARRLADAASSDLVELRCVAPATVTDERMRRRAGTEDPSDATPEVASAMTDALQAWPEAVTIDNRGDVEDAVEAALDEIDPAR